MRQFQILSRLSSMSFLPLALLLALLGGAHADACSNLTDGVIIGAGSIDAAPAADAGACCARCVADARCLAFTFDANASACYLKDDVFYREARADRVSGVVRPSPYGDGAIPRACATPATAGFAFCDASLGTQARVDDLIARLAWAEKAPLLTARESPAGAVPRLGLPEYDWGTNCIHGVQSRCAPPDPATGEVRCPTSYPNPNMLGASFNRSAWRAMGRAIGVELRALWAQNVPENHKSELPHVGLDCWSPNINVARDPRWGRALETTGEDPLVNGVFGALYTRGLQTSEDDARFLQAVVTLKHFAA